MNSAEPVKQVNNARYVSIIPENGTEFSARQKLVFNIDPSVGFLKAKDSYLVFDIENTSATFNRYSLSPAGISSIIKQVNIYSQHNGMLLESLNDYNKWVHCEMQYRIDDPQMISQVEGCNRHLQSRAGLIPDNNLPISLPNHRNTYSDVEHNRLSPVNATNQPIYQPVRFLTPLRCGIFRHWDDEALVPVLLMGGLRIELILAENHEVLDLPFIHDSAGRNGAMYHLNPKMLREIPVVATAGGANVANGVVVVDILEQGVIANTCGLAVGNKIRLNGTDTAGGAFTSLTTITAIDQTGNAGRTKITFADAIAGAGGGSVVNGNSNNPSTNRAVGAGGGLRLSLDPAFLTEGASSYKIRSAEFRLMLEMPPSPMKNMNYVFTSYDTFNDTIPRTQVNMNQDITSVASKAVSLFTLYENGATNNMSNVGMCEYYCGKAPFQAGFDLNSVVYFINNRLYPLRPYNPSPKEDKVINQNEVVKAFGTLNIPVKSLGCGEYCNLDIYTNRYLHARELARQPAIFNLQNAEPSIRLGFASGRGVDEMAEQIVNVRMGTFVFSKKILNIDGESGLTLEH
tara:strand:+ start:1716 stop:3431 length:1716 start_codon:yes stop_codon:yes gene_type:complete